MRLAHGPPERLGHTGGSDPRHHLRPLHGFRSAYPSRIRRAVEPDHASTTSNLYRSTPSLMHVMLPESSPSTRGPGIATPASSLPSDIAPHLRPLSSAGITRRLRSYGPLRHPDGPACPSRDSGWCVHTTDRASRVASIPLLHACRRHYPGGTDQCARRSLPSRWQPSPFYRRVGFRITRFEACSAFTKVAARMLAEPPMAVLLIGVLQTRSLPPSPAPTATGWSDSCRAGFAPAEGRRLRTAHGKVGLGCPGQGACPGNAQDQAALWNCGRVLRTGTRPAGRGDSPWTTLPRCPPPAPTHVPLAHKLHRTYKDLLTKNKRREPRQHCVFPTGAGTASSLRLPVLLWSYRTLTQ